MVSIAPTVRQGEECHAKDAVKNKQDDILNTLSRQIDRVINKAQSKLAALQKSVATTKAFNKSGNDHFVEDRTVEQELLRRQLEQAAKSIRSQHSQSSHRPKLEFNPLHIMGLVINQNINQTGQRVLLTRCQRCSFC